MVRVHLEFRFSAALIDAMEDWLSDLRQPSLLKIPFRESGRCLIALTDRQVDHIPILGSRAEVYNKMTVTTTAFPW